MAGKRSGILVPRGRYKCRDCSDSFIQPLPDMDDRRAMTRRLVEYKIGCLRELSDFGGHSPLALGFDKSYKVYHDGSAER